MDLWKFYSIGHADLPIMNPTSDAKFDELVELLAVSPEAQVLDIACGKAEFLVRAVERWGCAGVGVELSPLFAADARSRVDETQLSHRIEIIEQDGADYAGDSDRFDVTSCLGASWIYGGYSGTIDALMRWTRPGGLVISGEPYWKKAPDTAFCEAEGIGRDDFGTHQENVQTGIEKGLGFLHAMVSSESDWDRYQGYQSRAAERYARSHREDPDVPELLKQIHQYRDNYLRAGRDVLGWAIYLFMKDPVRLD